MMEKKYIIEARYEHRSPEGIQWTKWFTYAGSPVIESEGNAKIDLYKEDSKSIDKSTKLKHEFRLMPYDEYKTSLEEAMNESKKLKAEAAEYMKSDEYKELKKRKLAETKAIKERQAIYEKNHGN